MKTVTEAPFKAGYVGRIPIRNLWLLMLYASPLYKEISSSLSDREDSPDNIPDLVAEILACSVEKRLARNLSYAYQPRKNVLNRVRGKINLLQTARGQLLDKGQVACTFEELSIDTARNRFVCSALEKASRIVHCTKLSLWCTRLAQTFRTMGVSSGCPARNEVVGQRFGRHDTGDRRMVMAADLLFSLQIPNEEGSRHCLPAPDREERWIRKLFEKAVAGFYQVRLCPLGWKVSPSKILHWNITLGSDGINAILPRMEADIVLDSPEKHRIVIDTKFTSIFTASLYREQSLKSGYIYQIYAYLRSQEKNDDLVTNHATGVLLHPSIGQAVHEVVTIQGHDIKFMTVDLASDTSTVVRQLMDVVNAVDKPPYH